MCGVGTDGSEVLEEGLDGSVAEGLDGSVVEGLDGSVVEGAGLDGSTLACRSLLTFSTTNIGRATSSARSASRAMRESQDVGRAEETLGALQTQLAEMQATFKQESEDLKTRTDPSTESLETVNIKPKKKDITIKLVSLVWVPQSE